MLTEWVGWGVGRPTLSTLDGGKEEENDVSNYPHVVTHAMSNEKYQINMETPMTSTSSCQGWDCSTIF